MSTAEKRVRFADERAQMGFTQFPNALLRDAAISVEARLLWALLASYAWERDECFAGQDGLAEMMGRSERSVRAYLTELEGHGLIVVERRGLQQTNLYRLVRFSRSDLPIQTGSQLPVKTGSQLPTKKTQEEKKTKGSPIKPSPEFESWLAHHESVTGDITLRPGTQAYKKIAAMHAARLAEGYSIVDLNLAVEGAWADEFRRENGHTGPESVLRPTKVADLIAKGRRARKQSESVSPYDALEDR